MSAVKKLEYYQRDEQTTRADRSMTPSVVVKAQPIWLRLIATVVVLSSVLALGMAASLLINRYVTINQLQLDIFKAKQAIEVANVTLDELYIMRESYMTIGEIESFASAQLGMIKPTDRHKVIISSSDYVYLDKAVAFKRLDEKPVVDSKGRLTAFDFHSKSRANAVNGD